MRTAHPTTHTALMASAICAPSSADSCSGGKESSCTTVTVHVDAHSMTVGSAIEGFQEADEGDGGERAELPDEAAAEGTKEPAHG